MKKSVVLLFTLFLIIGITIFVYKIQKRVLEYDTIYKNFTEINSMMDMKIILDRELKDINSSEDIKNLFNSFEIMDYNITISPTNVGVDINNHYKLLYQYLNENISEVDTFMNLLQNSFEGIDEHIILKNRKFNSFVEFNKLLDLYVKTTDDFSIYKIEWEKLIYFNNKQLNIYFIKKPLLDIIAPDNEGEVTENIIENINDINITKFEPVIKVEVQKSGNYLSFEYDTKTKKVISSECFF